MNDTVWTLLKISWRIYVSLYLNELNSRLNYHLHSKEDREKNIIGINSIFWYGASA